MSRHVVFNADDLGMSPEIDRGILRAVEAGLVKEVSVCVNAQPDAHVIRDLMAAGAGIGLHFCVTEGRALCGQLPGLTGASGEFLGLPRLIVSAVTRRLSAESVRSELNAQLDALQDMGVTPSHVNGHHHAHAFPVIRDVVLREVLRRGCAHVRVPLEPAPLLSGGPRGVLLRQFGRGLAGTARRLGLNIRPVVGLELTGSPDYVKQAMTLAEGLSAEVVEWVVHPREGDTRRSFATVGARHAGPQELEALESASLRAVLERRGYQASSYRDLP